MKQTLCALALAAAVLALAAPAFAAEDDAIVSGPARIISAGGLVYAPVFLGTGHKEVGLALGSTNPFRAQGLANAQLLPLAGFGMGLSDGLDAAVLLSAESQVGLRQRYAAGKGWSVAGSYMARANVDPSMNWDYGGSYKIAGMVKMGTLELTAQPEISYFQKAAAQGGVALGADLWPNDRVSVGLNYQLRRSLATNTGDSRIGAGGKYLWTDRTYTWFNYVRGLENNLDVGLVGFGHYY
ncbi:MAG: hypothetical protein VKS61_08215 [Candidatus Sericytochromatia bacterium]|nr:hypothetical protein [Candidatus Sericytochromatia bacterium]